MVYFSELKFDTQTETLNLFMTLINYLTMIPAYSNIVNQQRKFLHSPVEENSR